MSLQLKSNNEMTTESTQQITHDHTNQIINQCDSLYQRLQTYLSKGFTGKPKPSH